MTYACQRGRLGAVLAALLLSAAAAGGADSLVSNGSFERGGEDANAPAGWPVPAGASWEVEEGNRFLRLRPPEPGKTVVVYRRVDLPAGCEALELSFRVRTEGVKRGKESWHDARVIVQFLDAAGKKLKGGPGHPHFAGTTDGWRERTLRFAVPPKAAALELMPALFEVPAGRMDIDDVRLAAMDRSKLPEADREQAEAAAVDGGKPAPPPLRVVGRELRTDDGEAVWLQGVSVPSLEWTPTGEHVLRSIVTAIDVWQANVIRLPVREHYWAGEGKHQRDGGTAYRRLVDQAVRATETRGAYLVLDLHRFRAPDANDLAFWRSAARRYAGRPGVLMSLFNEPHDISWKVWRDGGRVTVKSEAEGGEPRHFDSPGMQALAAAVRAAGADNVLIASGLDWGYDLSGVAGGFALAEPDPNARGIMYESHVYPWKSDWRGKVLSAAAKVPVLIGETGAPLKPMPFLPASSHENPYTWVPDMLACIQEHRLHWTAWAFHPKCGPAMLQDWAYTPTPHWGAFVRAALLGARFESDRMR